MTVVVSSSPFAFLSQDVAKQLELSRQIATEAKGLEDVIAKLDQLKIDGAIIEQLRRHKDSLVQLSNSLTSNATATANTGTFVLTTVSSSST